VKKKRNADAQDRHRGTIREDDKKMTENESVIERGEKENEIEDVKEKEEMVEEEESVNVIVKIEMEQTEEIKGMTEEAMTEEKGEETESETEKRRQVM